MCLTEGRERGTVPGQRRESVQSPGTMQRLVGRGEIRAGTDAEQAGRARAPRAARVRQGGRAGLGARGAVEVFGC